MHMSIRVQTAAAAKVFATHPLDISAFTNHPLDSLKVDHVAAAAAAQELSRHYDCVRLEMSARVWAKFEDGKLTWAVPWDYFFLPAEDGDILREEGAVRCLLTMLKMAHGASELASQHDLGFADGEWKPWKQIAYRNPVAV